MTQVGWDKPWDLAREFHKREGVPIKDMARIFGQQQKVIRQWVVPRPCPTRPLAERAAMLRKMGLSWNCAAQLLGYDRDHILRARLGHIRVRKSTLRRGQLRYRENLRKERIAANRA